MNATARPRSPMTEALREIQAPVRERLEEVSEEMRRIVVSDLPLIETVSEHLLKMRGKMFRPTLTLLASAVEGRPDRRAVTCGPQTRRRGHDALRRRAPERGRFRQRPGAARRHAPVRRAR